MTGISELHGAWQAVLSRPDKGGALSNLAHQLRMQDRPLDALSWSRWAVRSQAWRRGVVDPRAWRVLAAVLLDHGRFVDADAAYREAARATTSVMPLLGRSRAMEGLSRWPQAWALAEQRFRQRTLPVAALPAPHWLGWPRVDQLLVWDEQGFGDSFQALRWLPLALTHVRRVDVLVRPPLVRLLQQGLSWLGPGVQVRARPQGDVFAVEGACSGSLLSLPVLLRCQTLADGHVLRLPPIRRTQPGPLRIGLVWESGRYQDDPFHALEYRRKSLPAPVRQQLVTALVQRGTEVVSLQLGEDAVPEGADFLEQAKAMQSCDLLLSVDTAAAHLAGALGFPTWLLLPWAAASRWQRASSTTPLYGSLSLIRQPRPGDWDGLLNRLLQRFDQAVASSGLSRRRR